MEGSRVRSSEWKWEGSLIKDHDIVSPIWKHIAVFKDGIGVAILYEDMRLMAIT